MWLPWQPVQAAQHVGSKLLCIDLEMAKQPQQVGVALLQQLVQPMDQFDIGVAPQLAEHRSALQRFEKQRVEFSEQGKATDL